MPALCGVVSDLSPVSLSNKSAAVASPMASRRRRYGCAPLHRAPVLDLRCSVRCCKLCSQLAKGGGTSSKDGSRVIINDRRVWARMVAITLRFTVCSCLYRGAECHFGSAERRPARRPLMARIRPKADLCDTCQDPSRRKQHPHTRLSQLCSAIKREAASRAPDAKGRTSRRPTDHYEPPRDIDGQPQRPPASHNCSASVRAALSRADGRL